MLHWMTDIVSYFTLKFGCEGCACKTLAISLHQLNFMMESLIWSSLHCATYYCVWSCKIIDSIFQLYLRIILRKNISKIRIGVTTRLSSRNLFNHFVIFCQGRRILLNRLQWHRNTVISHLIYLKFAFAPVCIASSGRLFVHKGNMTCVSKLQFSCNHNYVATILKIDYKNFQNLFDLGLEHYYRLFQAIKYSIANWKNSKDSRNNRF